MPYIYYKVDMATYSSPRQVESDCNSIMFVNTGAEIADINGFRLLPNQHLAIDGNYGEFDTTTYLIMWPNSSSGGDGCQVSVVRKVYGTNPGAIYSQHEGRQGYNDIRSMNGVNNRRR